MISWRSLFLFSCFQFCWSVVKTTKPCLVRNCQFFDCAHLNSIETQIGVNSSQFPSSLFGLYKDKPVLSRGESFLSTQVICENPTPLHFNQCPDPTVIFFGRLKLYFRFRTFLV